VNIGEICGAEAPRGLKPTLQHPFEADFLRGLRPIIRSVTA
jgi:hypothetical protein